MVPLTTGASEATGTAAESTNQQHSEASDAAAALPPPPTYEQAMDMKEEAIIARQQAEEDLKRTEEDDEMESIHSHMESIGISSSNDKTNESSLEVSDKEDEKAKRKRGIRFRRFSAEGESDESSKSKNTPDSASNCSATVVSGPQKKKGKMARLFGIGKDKSGGSDKKYSAATSNNKAGGGDQLSETSVKGGGADLSVDIDTIFNSQNSNSKC